MGATLTAGLISILLVCGAFIDRTSACYTELGNGMWRVTLAREDPV
jgi:hypothetical protein